MPRRRLVIALLLAAVATGCSPQLFDEDDRPQLCVDAWNRGTEDGTAAPEGTVVRRTAGIGYGFVARRVSVRLRETRSCAVVFDLGGGAVFEFVTGSTGEQPPFGGDDGLAGWLPTRDLRSREYVRLVGAAWNACQNADGTLVLSAESCSPVGAAARRTPIARSLERRAARNLLAGRRLAGQTGFWLGPRFRGSVAETYTPHPGIVVPAGAAFEARYYPWRGLPAQRTLGPRLRLSVLTYAGRLERLPDCLEQLGGRCLQPFVPILRLERSGHTVVVVRTGPGSIPAGLVDELRRRLTDRPGFSVDELEAAEDEDFRLAGYPAGS